MNKLYHNATQNKFIIGPSKLIYCKCTAWVPLVLCTVSDKKGVLTFSNKVQYLTMSRSAVV